MHDYIKLSTLNDFIFSPKSIYYHNLYDNYDKTLYQDTPQIAGTLAHKSIDTKTYSTRSNVLQGLEVYCEQYGIAGKIDLFFIREGRLVERKNKIKAIYLGYRYQLWGQMFCLEEMGYHVEKLELYSISDNKTYKITRPDHLDREKFNNFLNIYRNFDIFAPDTHHNPNKCAHNIYREFCEGCITELYPQLELFPQEDFSF